MIRPATRFDIDHLISAATERYPPFEKGAAITWLAQAMNRPDTLVLWSPRGGAVATIAQPFWGGDTRCHLLFLVVRRSPGLSRASVQEGVALMRAIDHWRQTKGAQSFHFSEDTGQNFRVLAKALGAEQDRPSFRLGPTPQSVAAELFTRPKQNEAPSSRVRGALEQALGMR